MKVSKYWDWCIFSHRSGITQRIIADMATCGETSKFFDGIASIHQNSTIKKIFSLGNNGCLTALFFSALFCFTKIKGQIATLYSVLLGNCLPISTQMPMCYSFWFLKQFVPIECHPWSTKLVHFIGYEAAFLHLDKQREEAKNIDFTIGFVFNTCWQSIAIQKQSGKIVIFCISK